MRTRLLSATLFLFTLGTIGCNNDKPTYSVEDILKYPGEISPTATYRHNYLDPIKYATEFHWRGEKMSMPVCGGVVSGLYFTYTRDGFIYVTGPESAEALEMYGDPVILPTTVVWNGKMGRRYDRIEYLTVETLESCRVSHHPETIGQDSINLCDNRFNLDHCVCKGDGRPLYLAHRGEEHYVVFGEKEYGPYGKSDTISNLMVTDGLPSFDLIKSADDKRLNGERVYYHVVPGQLFEPHPSSELRRLVRTTR